MCSSPNYEGSANVNIWYNIIIVIYLPFKHKQFQINFNQLYAEMSTVTSSNVIRVFDCGLPGGETKLSFNRNMQKIEIIPIALVSDCYGYIFRIFKKHTG